MIDEKKLIEKIDSYIGYYNQPPYGIEVEGTVELLEQIKNVLNKQPKIGEWIPCSERLPEENEAVLATAYNDTSTAIYVFYYENGRWKDIDGYIVDVAEIIAWQKLPEPWKGENK